MTRINFFLLILVFSNGSVFAQQFEERSAAIGINHSFQARSLMGGGAAFFDYDNDGDEDIYLTGGIVKDHLYQNNGDGTFSKVTNDIGLNVTSQYNTTGITTGDIDNDGDRDLFVTTWEAYVNGNEPIARHLLFENNGNGTFTEIGVSAGINQPAFGLGAMFFDYDRDGLLDVYVINHVETPRFLYDSYGTIIGFDHDCYPNFLYHNNGNLTFTELAASVGLDDLSCTLAAIPSDFDMDGDLDIYLANDFGPFIVPNVLYQNNSPAPFQNISAGSGTNVAIYGMGIAAGDYDLDQDLDYYITNLGRNVLLENDNAVFTDVTTSAEVENEKAPGGEFTTGWGTAFLDVDNDALLDIYVANGRIPSLASLPTASIDPDKLFLNNGDKTFTDISDAAGIVNPGYSRGMSCADFDRDGDLDILVVNIDELGDHSKFYVNQTDNDHHFIQFKLIGKESNRDAFGSKLWLYAGGQAYLREIHGGGSSFSSQLSSIVHFGLKETDQIDSLRIEWPNGHIDHLGSFSVDTLHYVEEGIVTDVIELAGDKQIIDIRISPNPFNSQLKVVAEPAIPGVTELKLYGADGRKIFSQTVELNKETVITLEYQVPSGIYFLHIQTEGGAVIKKLMKAY